MTGKAYKSRRITVLPMYDRINLNGETLLTIIGFLGVVLLFLSLII